jgi:hypothetical protein
MYGDNGLYLLLYLIKIFMKYKKSPEECRELWDSMTGLDISKLDDFIDFLNKVRNKQ